ncbi:MAG: S41 family peptidase [Defluviitaleaceae bacterium]|nr:S41 family peptidase [Defluviitaleaceae bacterium]
MDNKKSFGIGLAAGIILTIIIVFSVNAYQQRSAWGELLDPNSKVTEIYELLSDISMFPIDKEVMLDSMYRGFLEGVGDPYTQYFDRQALQAFRERVAGEYVGVGVLVLEDVETMTLIVAQAFRGSPAAAAGLLPGDKIVGVDGVDVTGRPTAETMSMIRGPEGSAVNLAIYRPYEDERFNVSIVRTVITIPSVYHEMMSSHIGYIRIEGFDDATMEQFSEAMLELTAQNMQGLILDVRNNPGGGLHVVTYIANYFTPEGVVAYTIDAAGRRQNFNSDDTYLGLPLVVLINGRSASASELLSGAIQDTEMGILIGEQTFGKGIVQHLRPLSDGSAVKVTVAKYFTPSGTSIHGVGVAPDIEIEMDEALSRRIGDLSLEEDVQLQRALQVVQEIERVN